MASPEWSPSDIVYALSVIRNFVEGQSTVTSGSVTSHQRVLQSVKSASASTVSALQKLNDAVGRLPDKPEERDFIFSTLEAAMEPTGATPGSVTCQSFRAAVVVSRIISAAHGCLKDTTEEKDTEIEHLIEAYEIVRFSWGSTTLLQAALKVIFPSFSDVVLSRFSQFSEHMASVALNVRVHPLYEVCPPRGKSMFNARLGRLPSLVAFEACALSEVRFMCVLIFRLKALWEDLTVAFQDEEWG